MVPPFFSTDFFRFLTITDECFLNDLGSGIQANTKNAKVEFVDEVGSRNRFKMAVAFK